MTAGAMLRALGGTLLALVAKDHAAKTFQAHQSIYHPVCRKMVAKDLATAGAIVDESQSESEAKKSGLSPAVVPGLVLGIALGLAAAGIMSVMRKRNFK